MTDADLKNKWWGQFEFSKSTLGWWQIGSFSLWIKYLPFEIRIAYEPDNDLSDQKINIQIPCELMEFPETDQVLRFGVEAGKRGLRKIMSRFLFPTGRFIHVA